MNRSVIALVCQIFLNIALSRATATPVASVPLVWHTFFALARAPLITVGLIMEMDNGETEFLAAGMNLAEDSSGEETFRASFK